MPFRALVPLAAVILALGFWWIQSGPHTVAAGASAPSPLIMIDPGHGGIDPGAVGVNRTLEKHVNLAVSLDLGNILRQKGFRVFYTRARDHHALQGPFVVKPDLHYRAWLAQRYHASLFISIHSNAEPTHTVHGPIVYYNPQSPSSYRLARQIAPQLWRISQTRWAPRPINQLVLEEAQIPAVNVEVGFLTNRADEARLQNSHYQYRLAQAVAEGIRQYFRSY